MSPRPPIVAILGHVDHGKTTLLDYIRKSRLASHEHGGITQRIGAYEIVTEFKDYVTHKITFIDTPGHEAFAKLRARGATIADIALLIIDAKDSVMPQTIESISHIKEANIPFIVVLNKIDLPDANPEKVKNDLLKYEVVVEDKGGTVPTVAISSAKGTGVANLLESILLLAEDLKLQYDPANPAQAYIIEHKKDKRGVVVSAIIKDGRITVGTTVFAAKEKTRVRALINDLGKQVRAILPSSPFELLGFTELPEVGTLITTAEPAKSTIPSATAAPVERTIDPALLYATPQKEEKKLSLIIKTDTHGSLEAILAALGNKNNMTIVLAAVGAINKSDVFLAKTTASIIIGFASDTSSEVTGLAKQEKVIIKTYNIIYELFDELEEVADLLKEKELTEKNIKAEAKVLANFVIEGEKVCGVKVTKGKINMDDSAEVYRNDNLIGKTKLVSLKIRAKTVSEVRKEQEAGMVFSPQLDIRMGDVIKFIL
ncbi:GTP-binding protein [Candidatus Roizmanbacteria bacterium]|nr:GTP-binding protein [Candidatus Roizmanbacteria bacterium]